MTPPLDGVVMSKLIAALREYNHGSGLEAGLTLNEIEEDDDIYAAITLLNLSLSKLHRIARIRAVKREAAIYA
jgi:hypothetical protein